MKIPAVRGKIIEGAARGAGSWFGCGGPADILFRPADNDDLSTFLKARDTFLPLHVVGGMANMIIRDGGLRGYTVQPGKEFAEIKIFDDHYISAGAGALNGSVAAAAMKAGIGGLEFLSGIPGCVGGALSMNAGAYGTEIKDVLTGVYATTYSGDERRYVPQDLPMSYRHTELPEPLIFTGAVFKGVREDYETVKARVNDIKAKRNATQPIKEKTGGSTFANPGAEELKCAGLPEDTRAWKVVELVGGRGLQMGGAQMSEMHSNFLINTGDAKAADLENLGEEIRKRALNQYGLSLRWEIKRIGDV
ncbi:MAG: UDP-N-acetylmuramate dehydrogenase [Alphaproteobacteria bacterium]